MIDDPLAEIVSRAELLVVRRPSPARLDCSVPARWPGHTFSVTADPGPLSARIDAAAADVEHLWPGRAGDDGAISLVAINLHELIAVRRAAPISVVLTPAGGWVIEPPDEPLPRLAVDPDQLEWRADRG